MGKIIQRLTGAFIGWIGVLGTSAALTSEEVNLALDGQPGLNWAITGTYPQAWGTGMYLSGEKYLSLSIYADYPNTPYDLKTTVTGPGVLEVARRGGVTTLSRILINGSPSGSSLFQNPAYGPMIDRVELPAGSHTVTWRNTKGNAYGASINYSSAKWQPLTTLPIQVGAEGDAITLSGSWRGQNIWHHGDGGAAWSGLISPVAEGQSAPLNILRGEFNGPGVISFRCMPRGGPGRVRLDGGAWVDLRQTDVWTRHYRLVEGAGSHVIEFDVPPLVSTYRLQSEMLVDELKITPEIDRSVALDTPGRVWTPSTWYTQGKTYGTDMEPARGNAGLVIEPYTELSTPFPQAGLVIIRAMGTLGLKRGNQYPGGSIITEETTPDGTWYTRAYEIPEPNSSGNDLVFYANERVLVDSFEIVEKPASLDAAVGLPLGTLVTGGDHTWQVQPVSTLSGYTARLALNRSGESGWLEHTVTGPAEIKLNCYSKNQAFRVLVNGKVVWGEGGMAANQRLPWPVRIEVPAGEHVVRYFAEIPATEYASYESESWISSVQVNALSASGEFLAAVDFPGPIATTGTWAVSDTQSLLGGSALRPSPATTGGTNSEPRITIPVTGPGYLYLHSYLNPSDYGSTLEVVTSFNQSFNYGSYAIYTPASWSQHRIWIRQGDHIIRMTGRGDGEKFLDKFSFAPSQLLPLAEVINVPGAALASTPAGEPWTALRKSEEEPGVVISPMVQASSSKKLSMTVNGPGRISFKWKTVNRAEGSFLVNGVRSSLTLPYRATAEEHETLFIDGNGPVELQWEAAFVEYQSLTNGWIELRDVQWLPAIITPFAQALDGPAGSVWTTSPEHPFEGMPAPGAVGGTAANVVLGMNEQSWLETTVEGPGVFTFSMLESIAKPDGPGTAVLYVSLDIDGEVTTTTYGQMPPRLVLGQGTHTVRITFTNWPYVVGGTVAVAVDDVRWTPVEETEAGPEWTADSPGSMGAYPGMRSTDGADLIVLHPRAGTTRWMERSVTGPGLLSWESMITAESGDARTFSLLIDGVPAPVKRTSPTGWNKVELHIPPGEHTVRFVVDSTDISPAPPGEEEPMAAWQIAKMTYTPGETALMNALDSTAGMWLLLDGSYSSILPISESSPPDDFYHLGGGDLFLINPSMDHLLAKTSCMVGNNLQPPGNNWQAIVRWMLPQSSVLWNPLPLHGNDRLDTFNNFSMETISTVPLAVALDSPGAWDNSGWHGLASRSARDETDAAFSQVEHGQMHRFSREVQGPAIVTFYWKKDGSGRLRLTVNGSALTEEASRGWKRTEIRLNEGTHELEWLHNWMSGNDILPAAAWVDQMVIEQLPSRTLDQVAGGPGFTLTASSPAATGTWQPEFYQHTDDTWRDAAVSNSGDSILSAKIIGPAIVSFRGGVWRGIGWGPGIEVDGYVPTDDIILIKVDGDYKTWIKPIFTYWQDNAVYIPEGEHEISWQQMTIYLDGSGNTLVQPATDGRYHAGVDDVSVQTPRAHYDAWAAAQQLPEGVAEPGDDADNDGATNFEEYAFMSDPLHPQWKPYGPFLVTGPPMHALFSSNPDAPHVMQVYLETMSPAVNGELQVSTDMIHWTTVPDGTQPSMEWGLLVGGLGAYLEYPLDTGETKRFFRYKMEIPEKE